MVRRYDRGEDGPDLYVCDHCAAESARREPFCPFCGADGIEAD
ncbi:MAG: hypothetical protein R3B72_05880 [Polyangiaceae bacterium]